MLRKAKRCSIYIKCHCSDPALLGINSFLWRFINICESWKIKLLSYLCRCLLLVLIWWLNSFFSEFQCSALLSLPLQGAFNLPLCNKTFLIVELQMIQQWVQLPAEEASTVLHFFILIQASVCAGHHVDCKKQICLIQQGKQKLGEG